MEEFIHLRGARLHNLKNVSLSIPHNQLTVITGVSGSGKSTLAFDTIYAEGQRRYVESLSAYARQFLERMEKPLFDEIDGIAPAIAIRQKNTTRNPRSTVATSTECYDFLRLLFARVGRTFCPNDGSEVRKDSIDEVSARVLALPAGSRWVVLFPVPGAADTTPEKLQATLFGLRKNGFTRLFQDGRLFEFSTPESLLDVDFSKPVFVLVDRISISADLRQRVADSVEICFRESGEALLESASEPREVLRFTERFECRVCRTRFVEPEPTLFSFNSPAGACPRCQGFGNTLDIDMNLVVPNPFLSIDGGAVDPWNKPQYRPWLKAFRQAAAKKIRLDVPWMELTEEERTLAVDGAKSIHGIRDFFAYLERKKYKLHVRVFLSRYRGYAQCPECRGARVRKDALNVRVTGKSVLDVVRMSIREAWDFFRALELTREESAIAEKVLVEIRQRLQFLNDVGLDYLTLDRLASTLSGGEAQRIQLATCLGSRLAGACYVLDEPSIGLHSRDTGRLIRILEELRDLGNTILVVEHDRDVMRAADHIIDMGPGAGETGGEVVFEGSYKQLLKDRGRSLTGKYLSGERSAARRAAANGEEPRRWIHCLGARVHNLKNIDVSIPLERIVVVTGVSGSGKSTLVHSVIYQGLEAERKREVASGEAHEEEIADSAPRMACRELRGAEFVREVVMIDQSPIGRTPRSNPITYIKGFDLIRSLFASTPEAEKRGYTAGHFSFNIPGGRCETCQGDGTVTVEMQFLADVELVCEDCGGTRFKSSLLEIRHKGLNIHEVLRLTVRDAITFFADVPKIAARLRVLDDVGLGYLRLGQSATTLSGGEAQRVKLASHLGQASADGLLYIFDEPTTGLHFEDIAKLLDAFERLKKAGASLLIIEHNLDVIASADWIIDMGPEGGGGGGTVVAVGPPEVVAQAAGSHTAAYLREALTLQ